MQRFEDYQDRYENIAMERSDDGILELTFHTEGQPSWVFSDQAHQELGAAFHDIGEDRDNRVVIMTGTGNRFCADVDQRGFVENGRFSDAAGVDQMRWDGTRLLSEFLDIEVPVIAAINGPVAIFTALPVLADIVLATDSTVFADCTHLAAGAVPGDGVHIIWPMLLGLNRGRYFLLTGEELSARQALDLGVVNELLPREDLLPRARSLAGRLAKHRDTTLQATKRVLTFELQRRFRDELHYGLSVEMLALLDAIGDGSYEGETDSIVDLLPNHPR